MFPTADTEDIKQVTSLNREPCVFSDVRDSPENTQLAKQQNNRETTLNMLFKEIVVCIALALTTYGALHNSPSKVSKHPQAVRFFSQESVVTDWYRGQLSSALSFVNSVDVSFVMYYAPWDAESQFIRREFEIAAEILGDRVHFSAINCWNPGSECRLQHSKIPSWPILMAYTVTSRGVLYKGPRDAHSMVKFLELIMKPLERVSSTEDLVTLLSVCDAVALGYAPLSDTSKFYNIWYYVALKAREFDTIGEICFAVVTSVDVAMELGIQSVPNARLILWNTTKEYVTEEVHQPWNESSLLQWVLDNFTQPAARIIPLWKKAFSFEKYADGNPILLLFTPLNPLYEQLPSYALLREVAMEYYNCKKNESYQWISELVKLQQVQRLLYQQRDYEKYCQGLKLKKPVQKSRRYKKDVISQNNKYPWFNTTQDIKRPGTFNYILKQGLGISKVFESVDDESQILSTIAMLQHCDSQVMPAEKAFYDIYEQCEKYDESLTPEQELEHDLQEIAKTSMLPYEDDQLSTENLLQDKAEHSCKLWRFANRRGPPVAPVKIPRSQNITHIEGLACETNLTLHIIAVDSIRNHHLAEVLGLDIMNKKDNTAAVILDSKHEAQYFLSEEYSAKSLRDFIYNYTHKKLKRSLRTQVEDATHTHFFGSNGELDMQKETNDTTLRIIDLTTRTFRKIVRTPGTVSIVAVCGGACAAQTSLALGGAARLLRAGGVRARAARLDARRHDLPWHYTVHYYPTIFVFVADGSREAESRAYPARARVSAGGLAALALRLLGPRRHLRVRLQLCAATQMTLEKKTCLKELREHVTSVIGRNLKYWRQTEHKELKDSLLRRLQHLHRVALDLSTLHITDLHENNSKQKTLLNSLSLLTDNWNIDDSILRKNISLPATES